DAAGTLHLVDKRTLASYRTENTSLMPDDYRTRLTPGEIDQIVAFLATLNERRADPAAIPPGGVTAERLTKSSAEPHNWLMYWGDYRSTHFSGLQSIRADNVGRLQAAWTFPMPGDALLEATPVVVDGVMYTTQSGIVCALDARTGRQI